MVLRIKNQHHSTFRLLSSSRSYLVTFENFLFTFYTKSFTRSWFTNFITLEKYYTIHLTTQVKKISWKIYIIYIYIYIHIIIYIFIYIYIYIYIIIYIYHYIHIYHWKNMDIYIYIYIYIYCVCVRKGTPVKL